MTLTLTSDAIMLTSNVYIFRLWNSVITKVSSREMNGQLLLCQLVMESSKYLFYINGLDLKSGQENYTTCVNSKYSANITDRKKFKLH